MLNIIHIHQVLIYLHLFAFIFAISTIFNEDYKILKSRKIDLKEMKKTAMKVSISLIILWITGIILLAIRSGLELNIILENPKLMMKILVVTLLTLNGLLLHFYVFPHFKDPFKIKRIAVFICFLGTMSSTSWIYASLIGTAHIIAPIMSFQGYMALYFLFLIVSFIISMIIFYPLLIKLNHYSCDVLKYSLEIEIKQLIKIFKCKSKQIKIDRNVL